MAEAIRSYRAFISYSHRDAKIAAWVQRALERYRLPAKLIGQVTPLGPVPARLHPLFRDRDELPASSDLGTELMAALRHSMFLIVFCSPAAAASRWVGEEVLNFKRMHGEGRVLAVICGGEPGDPDAECFPLALRFKLGADGNLSDVPAEPIAADLRPGKDGKRLALLKLVAGLAGVPLDALAQRDAARRQQRLLYITAASLAVAALTIGLAIYAEGQRRVAVAQRLLADRSLEFLIGTFAIANPATENPRTITALTILDRVSKRAGTELRDEPAVSGRLLATTGEIYLNLGLPKEAERDLRAALALESAQSEERAHTLLRLAKSAFKRGDAKGSTALIDQAEQAVDPKASYAPALAAEVTEWRGMVAFLGGRYAESGRTLARAASLYQALPGEHSLELGRIWINQGQAIARANDHAGADEAFARAEALYRGKFGTDHVLWADAVRNRAWGAFEAGRLAEAETRSDQAIGIYRHVLEGDHPILAAALLLLGRIRTARGDAAGALAAFSQASGIYGRLYGPLNAAVGDVDFYAAEAESRRGDTEAALARLAHTQKIYDMSYGPNDPDQVELLMQRAKVLTAGGRTDEARRDCAAGLALQTRLDPKDPTLGEARQRCRALNPAPSAAP